jgi:hypothetical protein
MLYMVWFNILGHFLASFLDLPFGVLVCLESSSLFQLNVDGGTIDSTRSFLHEGFQLWSWQPCIKPSGMRCYVYCQLSGFLS